MEFDNGRCRTIEIAEVKLRNTADTCDIGGIKCNYNDNVCINANSYNSEISFSTNDLERWKIEANGSLVPLCDNTYNLGSNYQRMHHVYANHVDTDSIGDNYGNRIYINELTQMQREFTEMKDNQETVFDGTSWQPHEGEPSKISEMMKKMTESLEEVSSQYQQLTGMMVKFGQRMEDLEEKLSKEGNSLDNLGPAHAVFNMHNPPTGIPEGLLIENGPTEVYPSDYVTFEQLDSYLESLLSKDMYVSIMREVKIKHEDEVKKRFSECS